MKLGDLFIPVFSRADFTYDGDSHRVKSVLTTNLGATTTYFVGTHYEVTDGVVTKYYYAGTQRIAMRKAGTLYFVIGDHLGSTSIITDANGAVFSQTKYKAWGEVRQTTGTSPSNYTYTGQYSYAADFGLHFYNARWYDSSLGRFAQADTIVPGGVQGYDRYAYVNNNPIKYNDPTGHCGNYYEDTYAAYCQPGYNSTPTPTMNVHCGVSDFGAGFDGMLCGPGSQMDYQMTVWNSDDAPGFNFVYTQYTAAGSANQFARSYDQTKNISLLIIVGYSKGNESALFLAEQRHKNGLPVAALILIGPSDHGINLLDPNSKGNLFTYDLDGNALYADDFARRVSDVSQYAPVFIVDEGSFNDVFDNRYPLSLDSKYEDAYKYNSSAKHIVLDDYDWIREEAISWFNSLEGR